MAENTPGITVLIPTYNRAKVLGETLEALTRVDRDGIDCSIVVIDNNSNDNTREIAAEYAAKLPLSYLKEVRPGKNCALNKALRECELKDIVVFTDDDVTPTAKLAARNRLFGTEVAGHCRLRWQGGSSVAG